METYDPAYATSADRLPDQDLPNFEINLYSSGSHSGGLRTQNDPSAPFQRSNIIERKGAVDIRCSCQDVVHGDFSPTSSDFATLIVVDLRFDPRKRARRIAEVEISMEFSGIEPSDPGPEVFAIAPEGRLSLAQTTQHEQVTTGGDVNVGLGPVQGAQAGGNLKWEKSVERDSAEATTVMGWRDLRGRNWGKQNCASWTLLENQRDKSGVPAFLRAAILLKRRDEEPFQCMVKIKAKADFKSSLESIIGSVPKDDPVLFDPMLEPTNNLRQYDIDALGELDLKSLCDMTFNTTFDGAMKGW